MNHSTSIASISAAMAKAFAQIEGAEKNKTNPHFRAKYADLGNVVDAVKPALLKHGLWFSQVSYDIENHAAVETVIYHESGEWISCGIVSVPVSKADAQGFGSAMTYARRYSLSAAFGVAPEDDDANAAVVAAPRPKPNFKAGEAIEIGKLLRASTTIDELQKAWASLSPDQRAAYESIKDEVKAKLQ